MDIFNRLKKIPNLIRTPRGKLAVVVFNFALFFIVYFLLRPRLGLPIGMLGILPVVIGAWFYGLWVGALIAIGFYLVNTSLDSLLGWSEFRALLHTENLLVFLATLAASLVVGRLGEITRRHQDQIKQKETLLEVRNQYNQFLTLLNDILRAAMETEDMASMLKVLAARTGQLFRADDCYITFWEEKTRRTIPMVAYGALSDTYTTVHRFQPRERTLTQAVLEAGQALAIEDLKHTSLVSPNVAEEFPNLSALGLPLISGRRKLGAVILGFNRSHLFSAEEIERATLAARQISLAVTKAILLDEAGQRVDELAGLHSISQAFSLHADSRRTYGLLTEALAGLLGADLCVIGLYEPGQRELRAQTPAFGLDDNAAGLMHYTQRGQKKVWDFLRNGPLRANGEGEMPAEVRPLAHAWGVKSILAASLHDKDKQWIGAVLAGKKKGEFEEQDARRIQVFSDQSVIVIQNTRLLAGERKRLDQLSTLQAVASAATEADKADHLIERVTSLIGKRLYPDSFGVLLIDERSGELAVHSSYRVGKGKRKPPAEPGSGVPGKVARSGKPLRVDSHSSVAEPLGLHPASQSVLCVPLKVEDRLIGVVNAESKNSHAFTKEDQELLTILAGQLATAIQNLRAAEMEENQARLLTHSNSMIKALAEISARAAAASDLEGIVQNLGDELQKLGLTCLIALAEDETGSYRLRYTSLPTDVILLVEEMLGMKMGGFPLPVESLNILEDPTRRASLVTDMVPLMKALLPASDEKNIQPILDSIGATSGARTCHTPLIVEGKTIGILWIWGEGLHDNDMPTMVVFASQVAAAIHTARLLEQVKSLAITDELTRIYNRRHFFELAEQEFLRSRRYNHDLAAMILDIDHFKQFNDNHGHQVGDQVLYAVAQMLRTNLRDVDILGRYGGEEFSVLLPSTNLAAAVLAGKRLHSHAAENPFPTSAGPLSVRFSIGISALTGKDDSLQALINRADKAMYMAKNSGRNKLAVM